GSRHEDLTHRCTRHRNGRLRTAELDLATPRRTRSSAVTQRISASQWLTQGGEALAPPPPRVAVGPHRTDEPARLRVRFAPGREANHGMGVMSVTAYFCTVSKSQRPAR